MLSVKRDADVPRAAWIAIVARLNVDGSLLAGSAEQIVPIERFLLSRRDFQQIRRQHGLTVVMTDDVREVLQSARAQQEFLSQVLQGSLPQISAHEVDERLASSAFARCLTPFQLANVAKLYSLREAGADFSVPGAGKTTTALAVHTLLKQDGAVDRLLVIAPLSAFEAWEDECEECFSPPLTISAFSDRSGNEDVVLIHYQVIAQRYEELADYCRSHRAHLVLDEAHRMKRGRAGQWGRACIDLSFAVPRRDVLTGTPAPQSAADLEALMAAMWPSAGAGLIPANARAVGAPEEALKVVAKRIGPLFVRTRKADLGLPPPDVKARPVTMGPVQEEIYRALRQRWRDAADGGPSEIQARQLGQISTYLLMAAVHPGLLRGALTDTTAPLRLRWPLTTIPPDADVLEKIRDYGNYEHPAKYETLLGMVKENADNGRKTLVWTTFVQSVTTIAEEYLAAFEPAVVHGSTPTVGGEADPATRRNQVRRFRQDPDCWVLVANPAAMSEGISLHHDCHEAIYVDRSFNAGQFLQSIDRIHRLGLDPSEHTRVRFLVSRHTVDEAISDRLSVKTDALGRMLDDPELALLRLTDEDDSDYDLDADDRSALLAHLKGDA